MQDSRLQSQRLPDSKSPIARPAVNFSIDSIMGRRKTSDKLDTAFINGSVSSGKSHETHICLHHFLTCPTAFSRDRHELLAGGPQSQFLGLATSSGESIDRAAIKPPTSPRSLVTSTSSPLSPDSEHDYRVEASSPRQTPSPSEDFFEGSRSPTASEVTAGSVDADRPRSRTVDSVSGGTKRSSSKESKSSGGPNPFAEGLKPRMNCQELAGVECHLENKDLWDKFNELGTEMIITKTGR